MTDRRGTDSSTGKRISRRDFLSGAAAVTGAFTVVPRHVLGRAGHTPPSEMVNVAVIGTGGQGLHNIRALFGQADAQVIAICDVNEESDYSRFYYRGTAGRGPQSRRRAQDLRVIH
ncbi:MAG: twin-arginine translocation signal domain-containing protein [Planctomycetota bacterium]|jgi:ornithine cyclodeaminase/alanine dehydrogenase-like protein (mu-crystallin family)